MYGYDVAAGSILYGLLSDSSPASVLIYDYDNPKMIHYEVGLDTHQVINFPIGGLPILHKATILYMLHYQPRISQENLHVKVYCGLRDL